MARIRTIKPEFPQSESMGRVSRDARLLFILLWPISDDHGRTRAASRMLASLLFPYDEDAPKLIDGWLGELEREGCIVRYEVDGSSYLQVTKWLKHQKIDKPSKPQHPGFDEASRVFESVRETLALDQGPRTKETEEEGKVTNPSQPEHPKKKQSDDCPHEEIVAVYHEVLPELAKVRVWNESRKKSLRARWNEDKERQTIDWWRWFFNEVRKSKFLMGSQPFANGDTFSCTLEWLLQPEKFARVLEQYYERDRGPKASNTTVQSGPKYYTADELGL